MCQLNLKSLLLIVTLPLTVTQVFAQTAPSATEIAGYEDLHAAAHTGNLQSLETLLLSGSNIEALDSYSRTPLHVAAYASNDEIVERLAKAGANLNALELHAYDIVTIAAVANDLALMDLALRLGAKSGNVTSPYHGTALIAAADRGHIEVVQRLIDAGAPLDHINNLGWTALLEAVILGDGGPNYVAIVEALLKGGANQTLADKDGMTPLKHAQQRGFDNMVKILEANK